MDNRLCVLHLEDSPNDAELIHAKLEEADILADFTVVQTQESFVRELEQGEFDLVISDFSLPSFDGKRALELVRRLRPETPFIFVSGTIGEDAAIESLVLGATDYVLKTKLSRLVPAVLRALQERQAKMERKRVEEALGRSEDQYRNLVDNALVGVYKTTPAGDLIYVNEALARMLDYASPRELMATKAVELYKNPEDRQRLLEYLRRHGVIREFETTLVTRSGDIRNVFISARLDKDSMSGMILDMTERKRAEEARRESEERFRNFVENINEVIFSVDTEGRFTYISPVIQGIMGFQPSEIIGKPAADLVYPPDVPLLSGNLKAALSGMLSSAEYRVLDKSQKIRWVRTSSRVIRYQGEIVGVQGVLTDITEMRLLEEQFRQAQKLESLGILAGGIAHDFNNILGIIMGHVSLLARVKDDPQLHGTSSAAIDSALKRGAGLVRQLLTFARKTDTELQQVFMNDLVKEIVRLLRETLPKTIEIVTEMESNLPSFSADGGQIHQLLLNLCVNARDAMPAGGRLRIRTSSAGQDLVRQRFPIASGQKYIAVEVGDTGTGMDESTKSRIFEPFFTTKEAGKGTGLGLAVVFGVVQTHKGFIDVESEPGKGTTFRAYFPVETTPSPLRDNQKAESFLPVQGTETVLIVEDEPLLYETSRITLTKHGYNVLYAKDGLEALDVYKNQAAEINLVLTDIDLPKLNGKELIRALLGIHPMLKIIFVSGYLEPDTKSSILRLGAKAFLQKPFDPLEMLKKVREVLDAKQP